MSPPRWKNVHYTQFSITSSVPTQFLLFYKYKHRSFPTASPAAAGSVAWNRQLLPGAASPDGEERCATREEHHQPWAGSGQSSCGETRVSPHGKAADRSSGGSLTQGTDQVPEPPWQDQNLGLLECLTSTSSQQPPAWTAMTPSLKRLLEVMVAGYPVLLVRNRMEFHALGSKCPHYGAPLSKGVLRGDRLRCPWHGACFNIRTGDIEEYPALDCISCFKVTVEDGKVFITAKKKDLESSLRVKDTSRRCLLNRNTMLLLGGGVAALVCAETLRQEGFTGRIIMATNEKHVPYDKSKLSKEMNLKAEDVYLRKPEFLEAQGIEFWTEKEAVSVDFQKQKVRFMDGSSQKYHQLLIATGSHCGFLKVPGADLQNICTLQTPEESSKILELATGKNLVIVGASFIGMEVAAFLSDKAGTISVVEREEFPFQHALGPQVGGVTMKMLQNKGVKFHMKTELCELKGKDGKVTEAVLANGENLPADVVVVGIGHCAALNMLKRGKELHTVPYFWTTLLGKSIRYAGCGKGYTDTVVKGSLEQQKFLIFYIRDGHVTAAASLNCDPMVSLIAEVFYLGKQISKEEAEACDIGNIPSLAQS
ncbi:apoptosis-inducing factor 3-like isoform X2 [Parus major]|uniref:apoptosis-inducing factor 3-like isoform X2 n=1 Tax=Parus major TaxID=9157 RepID=UPI001444860E|nr:apoptosis-inducing factor 3-like isoform X2 [Parus major]